MIELWCCGVQHSCEKEVRKAISMLLREIDSIRGRGAPFIGLSRESTRMTSYKVNKLLPDFRKARNPHVPY